MISKLIRDNQWSYLAEGNKNMILSLHEFKTVVRVFKGSDPGQPDTDPMCTYIFYNGVIKSLIGQFTYDFIGTVCLSVDDATHINARTLRERPGNRKHKAARPGLALLLPNFALLPKAYSPEPVYSVELKLKQGWVHADNFLMGKCVFCYTQYKKLKENAIKARSGYCPIRMCHGDKHVMLKLFENLLENPQNNLRIFKNGKTLLSSDMNELTNEHFYDDVIPGDKIVSFFEFIVALLLHDFRSDCVEVEYCAQNEGNVTTNNVKSREFSDYTDCKAYASSANATSNLPKGSVLELIHTLLKTNGQCLRDMKEALTKAKTRYANENLDHWNILKINEILSVRVDDELELLKKHLLFSTIGDCSIIVSVQRLRESLHGDSYANNDTDFVGLVRALNLTNFVHEDKLNVNAIRYRNCDFIVSINIADLDSKYLMIVDKHIKQRNFAEKCIVEYETEISN